MPKRIRVALTDDHALVRHALKAFISSQPCFEVVAEAKDGHELLAQIEKRLFEADVLLLDLYAPRGNITEALPAIMRHMPAAGIVVFSMYHNPELIAELFDMGVHAFVSKAADQKELLGALQTAADDEVFRNVFYRAAFQLLQTNGYRDAAHSAVLLSKTERVILQLLWEDKSNKEIAAILCLSLSAVEKLKAALKEKTGARSNLGLVKYALNNGVISDRMAGMV